MSRYIKKHTHTIILCLVILCSFSGSFLFADGATSSSTLSDIQKNSVAMLNYLSALTQEINSSKNSRIFLEGAYSSLINNTYPNAVDEETQYHLNSLLDNLEKYRMTTIKRDRLHYLFELNQAQALKSAIPNPLGLLSAVQSRSPIQLMASVIYMAVDSYSSYSSAKSEGELQYLQDGWELDDEERTTLHGAKKSAFNYMLNIVRDYNLPGDFALSEKSIDDFVTWKNNGNLTQRIQFFEANKKTYQSFGSYWLALAEAYYGIKEYSKCLDAISEYEKIQTRIFRKDYNFAKTLTMAIISAREYYDSATYRRVAERFGKIIIANTDTEDWAIRYFVAQIYVELAGMNSDLSEITRILHLAYDIILNNVNFLVTGQKSLNNDYLAPVQQITIDKDAPKEKKKEIKEYNNFLTTNRKIELAPIYEPLVLNCNLLYALADQLQISDNERAKIEGILKDDGAGIYFVSPLNDYYNLSSDGSEFIDVSFTRDKVKIPLKYISDNNFIEVTINTAGKENVFDDWAISSVDRKKDSDVESFYALYTSNKLKNYKYGDSSNVIIKIWPDKEEANLFTFKFVIDEFKKSWIFFDTVKFRRVL